MPLRYLHPPFAVLGDLSQGEDGLPAELCNAGRYERTEVSRHARAAIGASYLADKGTDLRTMQDYLSYRDKAHGALAAPLGIGSRGCGVAAQPSELR